MLEGPALSELGPAPANAGIGPPAGAELGPAAGTEGAKEEVDFLGGTYHDCGGGGGKAYILLPDSELDMSRDFRDCCC